MKKIKLPIFLIASALILASCAGPSEDIDSDELNALQEAFFENVYNDAQISSETFSISGSSDTLLVGEKGTQLRIYPSSFETLAGKTYDGEIKIELKEAYDPVDFVMANLTTTGENRTLQSGGMFYLSASTESGEKLFLKEDQSIGVIVPTTEVDLDMRIFEGDRSVGFMTWSQPEEILNSEIQSLYRSTNWVWYTYTGMDSLEMEVFTRDSIEDWFWSPEREVGDSYVSGEKKVTITEFTVEVDTVRFQELEDGTFIQEVVTRRGSNAYVEDFNTNYIFSIKNLGWTNIDKIYEDERSDYVELYVAIENQHEFDYVYTSLIVDDQNVYIPGYQRKDMRYGFTSSDYDRPKLPVGATCKVLATAYKDQKPFFQIHEFTVTEKQELQFSLKPSTMDEMKAELEEKL